ncbi:MAG: hypothetical protein VB079_06375 [Petrimonas sp.]|uniref:hypothetical protein n=1 Tax=Petrimonas sp. TaxID=2023866 RepID=UPI002B3AB245|nr:hypothetical protein [Petrimonas sp.]MEA5062040.1 hypothetical protein [Petrimonas sp.]
MNRLFLLPLLTLLMLGCKNEVSRENGRKLNDTFELVQDRAFKNGLILRGDNSSYPEAVGYFYPFGMSEKEPNWALAQWGTRNVMKDISPVTKNDSIIYQQDTKRIFFYPQKGGNMKIGLEVFASKEYLASRRLGEDWVHLLLEQNFTKHIQLKTIQSLEYKIKARLLFCNNRMEDEYSPDLHTAQITLFLTVQNRVKGSPQYGDFFWFGLPLYDFRHEKIAEYGAQDLGKEDASKKFISTVASDELFSGSIHSMDWITIDKNIYPLIKKSFETAQSRGYMKNSRWEDLCISSMNLGWEVPGTFDCGIIFECPSFLITLKEDN